MQQVKQVRTQRVRLLKKKTKTEMRISLKEIPVSTGNATAVIKEVTGLLIVRRRKENRKTMTTKTYSWEQHYVKHSKKRTIKKILMESYMIAERHHTLLTSKKDTTEVKTFDINVMVGNGQKMKYELKCSVNMKLQDGQTVKLTKVLYVPQSGKIF